MWISATPSSNVTLPFTYPHILTLLTSNSLLSMMIASLASVIQLSLTYSNVPDEAQMNNHQASYLVNVHLIFVLRAFVFGVFTCLYVYVCLLVLCPYVLTCNSIMLQTNPSPLEKALSKNFSHPSNECFIRRENPKNRVAMFSRYR